MRVHVIGAGIAGLAAALCLAQAGCPVRLYEATGVAGGRCRSLRDPWLGATLNSGIHLVLGYQRSLARFLRDAGAPALQRLPLETCGFVDCLDGLAWRVRPDPGRVPWWLLDPRRRTPGTGVADLATALRLEWVDPLARVAEVIGRRGLAWRRFWEPFCIAVLNTRPEHAACGLLRPFLRQLHFGGPDGRDPWGAVGDLSAVFVAPALRRLRDLGVLPAWRQPLMALELAGGRVTGLCFRARRVSLGDGDAVVLAVPPRAAARLVPGVVPLPDSGIVVAHFRLPRSLPTRFHTVLAGEPLGVPLWVLVQGGLATATVGAANALIPLPAPVLARRLWEGVSPGLDLPAPVPPARVLKYRGGTYLHSPAAERAKPDPSGGLVNLRLAGDWTLPGVAASLESAARSGYAAAETLLRAG